MRFVSKAKNFRLVLRPAIAANPLIGTPGKPGLSVLFVDGEVEVKEESTIDLMEKSESFKVDFFPVESEEDLRRFSREPEPGRKIMSFKYGHVDEVIDQKPPVRIPPALRKAIEEEAKKMAMAMVPELLKTLVADAKAKAVPAADATEPPPPVEAPGAGYAPEPVPEGETPEEAIAREKKQKRTKKTAL